MSTEIQRAVGDGLPVADTIFVGGGTPTLVPADALAELIASIPRRDDAEVTVECNPDDVTVEMLRTYRSGGVNRVSVGVQSMSPHVLAALGRTHDPANVERAVAAIGEAEMPTFNLDVIYGAAGESVDDWRRTVEEVLAFDPPHVSAYGLTVEAGTVLAAQPERHPDDDDQADKYELADELLDGGRSRELRGVELGTTGSRVAPQLPLLAAGRLPRVRMCGSLASRRPSLVERADTRSLHRSDHGGQAGRVRGGGARRRGPTGRRAATDASHA